MTATCSSYTKTASTDWTPVRYHVMFIDTVTLEFETLAIGDTQELVHSMKVRD